MLGYHTALTAGWDLRLSVEGLASVYPEALCKQLGGQPSGSELLQEFLELH